VIIKYNLLIGGINEGVTCKDAIAVNSPLFVDTLGSVWYKGAGDTSCEVGHSVWVEVEPMSAEQQTPEQPDKEKLRQLQEEIRRRDGEIANIEFELRIVLEVMRSRNVAPPCNIPPKQKNS